MSQHCSTKIGVVKNGNDAEIAQAMTSHEREHFNNFRDITQKIKAAVYTKIVIVYYSLHFIIDFVC